MQPLIKWPGGKSKEFPYIKDMIPKFDRYVEPFFGGGAVFFNLKPKRAIINDICFELVEFYKFIKNENNRNEFKKDMYDYVDNWEKIATYINFFENKLVKLYNDYKKDLIDDKELKNKIISYIEKEENNFNGLFKRHFCINELNLLKQITNNLFSKIKRTKKIEKEKGEMEDGDLSKNIETAFRSGFYTHFRDIMNYSEEYKLTLSKKISNYYFIREFCYASMFRFNSDGKFNIPYGGIGYNNKNFRSKVDYMFSDEIEKIFENTIIENSDFEKIFEKYNLTEKDFIFLDPPYDTDFSDYEKSEFGKIDQERLSNCLRKTRAKFILIIKNTDFINNLYKDYFKIEKFEKKYLYNVKGRNNRDVEHLVIYNF